MDVVVLVMIVVRVGVGVGIFVVGVVIIGAHELGAACCSCCSLSRSL